MEEELREASDLRGANDNSRGKKREREPEIIRLTTSEHDELIAKLKQFETLEDKMLRSAADFENAKKRLLKEKEEFSQYVLENLLYEFLPVLDNFERALAHGAGFGASQEKSIWDGVELVYKQFSSVLKSQGLTRMETFKKPFDPHLHEAVAQVESSEEDGIIAEEVVAGYLLREKVLRPAKVKVFAAKGSSAEEKIEEIT